MRDLYRFARLEAVRCYSGQGDNGIRQWNQTNWWPWVTDKLMEHVKGEVCWLQFDQDKFGILKSDENLRVNILNQYNSYKNDSNSEDCAEEFLEKLNYLLAT
ncbi:hypothetical protein ACFL54_01835 [Planctomycetota bacterium]